VNRVCEKREMSEKDARKGKQGRKLVEVTGTELGGTEGIDRENHTRRGKIEVGKRETRGKGKGSNPQPKKKILTFSNWRKKTEGDGARGTGRRRPFLGLFMVSGGRGKLKKRTPISSLLRKKKERDENKVAIREKNN